MHALHLIAGLDRDHGGPSYSVPRLCSALRDLDVETHIHTVKGMNTPSDPFITAHKQDFASIPLFRALRLSAHFARAVQTEAFASDIVHAHGLWLMPNVNAGRLAAKAKKPFIVSPRGMLSPEALAFSARKKRIFWNLLQGPAYARAAVWHATSEAEATTIRNFGIRAPIAIIPNGIDVPHDDRTHVPSKDNHHEILFLGRLHPKKGLPDLITAWSKLGDKRPDWTLRIVGPDEGGHRGELEKLVLELKVPRVVFDGPVHGTKKAHTLHDADLFVLPTQNENFGIAVAEALASGIPAIVTHGAPWPGLETERCGWWIERGIEPLVCAMQEATALDDKDRRAMGKRGRMLVARDYNWDRIALDMRSVYEWATGWTERPPMVHLD